MVDIIDSKNLKVGDTVIWKWPGYTYNATILYTGIVEHIATNDWICVRERHHWLLTFWYRLFNMETEWIKLDELASFARVTDHDGNLPT